MIVGKKLLITGATGEVARPIAEHLAEHNEVWCAARFSNAAHKQQIEQRGIKTFGWTLGSGDFNGLPRDFDYVVHSAWNTFDVGNDYDAALTANAEGTGLLMDHCRAARAFMFISSLSVYKASDDPLHRYMERTDPLGCHPAYAPPNSIAKIAAETVVRTLARIYKVPAIIARLGMACGTASHGGVPSIVFRRMLAGETIVHPTGKSYNSIIDQSDWVAQVEPLLAAASVPATIVNWCGDDSVGEVELYDYIGRISGVKPKLLADDSFSWGGGIGDSTARRAITGPNRVGWKKSVLLSLRSNFPDRSFVDTDGCLS